MQIQSDFINCFFDEYFVKNKFNKWKSEDVGKESKEFLFSITALQCKQSSHQETRTRRTITPTNYKRNNQNRQRIVIITIIMIITCNPRIPLRKQIHVHKEIVKTVEVITLLYEEYDLQFQTNFILYAFYRVLLFLLHFILRHSFLTLCLFFFFNLYISLEKIR